MLTTVYREKQSLYCCTSRYWPRSFVLSIAGMKKTVRTVGTELNVCMDIFGSRHETRTVVMKELFDEVYMGEDHTPTAVTFKLQFIKGVTREPTRR